MRQLCADLLVECCQMTNAQADALWFDSSVPMVGATRSGRCGGVKSARLGRLPGPQCGDGVSARRHLRVFCCGAVRIGLTECNSWMGG
jgi:hypothetical protein